MASASLTRFCESQTCFADQAYTAREMTRILWIIGFSITVLMFGLFAALSLAALATRRFLNLGTWASFITFSSSTYFMLGRLHAAMRYGDPTKDLDQSN